MLENKQLRNSNLIIKAGQIENELEKTKTKLLQNKQLYLEAKTSQLEETKLKLALQTITAEMRRLYRRKKASNQSVIARVPIDSEYIIFIIDTSGSMFRYAWPKVIKQLEET